MQGYLSKVHVEITEHYEQKIMNNIPVVDTSKNLIKPQNYYTCGQTLSMQNTNS